MAGMLDYRAGVSDRPDGFFSTRWGLFVLLVLPSFVLDVLLVLRFSAPGSAGSVMTEMIGTFALGPFCTYRLSGGVEVNPMVACLSIALMLGHPIRKNWIGAAATICGFAIWWALACRVILNILP